MGSFSLLHWLVVLGIALLLFGNRLPGIGRSLGEGIRNFKAGLNGDEDENQANNQQPPKANNGETKQITSTHAESAQQNEPSKHQNQS